MSVRIVSFFLVIAGIAALTSAALPATASSLGDDIYGQQEAARTGTAGAGTEGDPVVIVTRIVNAALGLIGAIFVSLMVYAGFRWMTAGGDKDAVETAQKTIRNSIIGLIVVLLAYSISNFVIQRLIFATF